MKKNIAAENEARRTGIPNVNEIVAAQQTAPTIGPTKNQPAGSVKFKIAHGTMAAAKHSRRISQGGKSPSLVVAIRTPRTSAEIRMGIIL